MVDFWETQLKQSFSESGVVVVYNVVILEAKSLALTPLVYVCALWPLSACSKIVSRKFSELQEYPDYCDIYDRAL